MCVCVCVRVGAGVKSTDASSDSGPWGLGAPGSISLCAVCFLRVSSYLSLCLSLFSFACLSVCLCVSLAEAGEGWVCPPVCLRDSGTTGPFTSLLQQLESDPSWVQSPGRFRSQQRLTGVALLCSSAGPTVTPRTRHTGPSPEASLRLHSPDGRMGAMKRVTDNVRRMDAQPWSVNS